MNISSITHATIEKYKRQRMETMTRRGGDRKIASVNRELELMRAILNYAKREAWLIKNPFTMGQSIISHADETKRDRILTLEEETRLLAACTDKRGICGLFGFARLTPE